MTDPHFRVRRVSTDIRRQVQCGYTHYIHRSRSQKAGEARVYLLARQPVAVNLSLGSNSTRRDLQGQSIGLDKPFLGCWKPLALLWFITQGRQVWGFNNNTLHRAGCVWRIMGGPWGAKEGAMEEVPEGDVPEKRHAQEVALVSAPVRQCWLACTPGAALQTFCPQIQLLWLSHLKSVPPSFYSNIGYLCHCLETMSVITVAMSK